MAPDQLIILRPEAGAGKKQHPGIGMENPQIYRYRTAFGERIRPLPEPSFSGRTPYEEPDQRLKKAMRPVSQRTNAVMREASKEMIVATTAATVATGTATAAAIPASFIMYPMLHAAAAITFGVLGFVVALAAFLFSLGSREFFVYNNKQIGHVKPRSLKTIANDEQNELAWRLREAVQVEPAMKTAA